MIVPILGVIDLATFLGTISWLVRDKLELGSANVGTTNGA